VNVSIIDASFYTLFQPIVENMIGQDAILRIVNAQMSAARLSEAISWSISYDHTVQSPRQSQAGGAMPGAPGGRRNFERCARHAFVRDTKILRLYNCAADRTAPRAKTPGAPSVEAPAVKAPGQQRSEPLPKFVRAALITVRRPCHHQPLRKTGGGGAGLRQVIEAPILLESRCLSG
jgi:hypothetical protein